MTHDIVNVTEGLEISIHNGEEGSAVRLHGRLNIDSSSRLQSSPRMARLDPPPSLER